MDPNYCYKISWSLTRLIIKLAGQTFKSTIFSSRLHISLLYSISSYSEILYVKCTQDGRNNIFVCSQRALATYSDLGFKDKGKANLNSNFAQGYTSHCAGCKQHQQKIECKEISPFMVTTGKTKVAEIRNPSTSCISYAKQLNIYYQSYSSACTLLLIGPIQLVLLHK